MLLIKKTKTWPTCFAAAIAFATVCGATIPSMAQQDAPPAPHVVANASDELPEIGKPSYLIQQPVPSEETPPILQLEQTAIHPLNSARSDNQSQYFHPQASVHEREVGVTPCDCDHSSVPPHIRTHQRSCFRCPQCSEGICQLKEKEVKEEKKCFVVKSKKICIPAIRLPWQKCETKNGRVKTIRTLSTKKYECPKCEYKWEIVEPDNADKAKQVPASETPNATDPNAQPESQQDGSLEPVPSDKQVTYKRLPPVRPQTTKRNAANNYLPPIVKPALKTERVAPPLPPIRKASLRPNLFSNRNR